MCTCKMHHRLSLRLSFGWVHFLERTWMGGRMSLGVSFKIGNRVWVFRFFLSGTGLRELGSQIFSCQMSTGKTWHEVEIMAWRRIARPYSVCAMRTAHGGGVPPGDAPADLCQPPPNECLHLAATPPPPRNWGLGWNGARIRFIWAWFWSLNHFIWNGLNIYQSPTPNLSRTASLTPQSSLLAIPKRMDHPSGSREETRILLNPRRQWFRSASFGGGQNRNVHNTPQLSYCDSDPTPNPHNPSPDLYFYFYLNLYLYPGPP